MTRLARLRRADLGRRRVGPREERPAGDDEGRDDGNLGNLCKPVFVTVMVMIQLLGARVWFRTYENSQ